MRGRKKKTRRIGKGGEIEKERNCKKRREKRKRKRERRRRRKKKVVYQSIFILLRHQIFLQFISSTIETSF